MVRNPPSSLDKQKLSPTQLSILEILIRDGIEHEISSEALAKANMISSIVLATSRSKKAGKIIPERVQAILSTSIPYISFSSASKERSDQEILAEARKEAEILVSNPMLSPLAFLTGGKPAE